MIRYVAIIAVSACLGCERAPSPQPDAQPASEFSAQGYEQLSATDSAYLEQNAESFAGIPTVRQVRRIPLAPACDVEARVHCFADTARVHAVCCSGGLTSSWLLLLDSSDSLELFVVPGDGIRRRSALVGIEPVGRVSPFQEHDINTASYLRYQFPEAGTYTFGVTIAPDGAVERIPFELRVRDDFRRPTRRFATALLELPGDSTALYFVRRNRSKSITLPQDSLFMARAGRYRVLAPGADTVFICTRGCESVRAVPLSGG